MNSPATTNEDSIESRILDAALVQFEQVGVKKTTIEDIARQAGVDRVTVYRRIGSRDDVVQAVVQREVAAFLAELAAIPERHDNLADLVADIFVTVVTRWRSHGLVNRMLVLEPERLILKLTTEGANVFALSVATTASALQNAVDRGLVTNGSEVPARAEVLCRIVHSLLLAPHSGLKLDTEAELAAFARTYLVPIVER